METELTQQIKEMSEKMNVLAKTSEIAGEDTLVKEGELAEEKLKNHDMSLRLQEQRKHFKQQLLLKTLETKALSNDIQKSCEGINKLQEEQAAHESVGETYMINIMRSKG